MTRLLDAMPEQLRALADRHVGVVPILEECMVATDEPALPRVVSELAAGAELLGVELGHAAGMGGTGLTYAEAAAAAVGEAVERYSASHLPWERFVVATADELGAAAVSPESFGLFDQSQYATPGFPFEPFCSDSRLRWVEGVDLETNDPSWLPVELVYLADAVQPGERRIGHSTSSGLACAPTRADAIAAGLLELLERDAFMLTWSLRLSLPRLDVGERGEIDALARRWFDPTGLDYTAIDLSSFHDVPTVLGVVRAPGSGGALGIGAAAATDAGRAWWKALAEAFAGRSASRKLALLAAGRRLEPDDVLTFEDHIRFYADDDRAAVADFLVASSERRDVRELAQLPRGGNARQACLVQRIRAAGSDCYAVDVTAPDVRSAGLHVVRTIAPGLCSLDVAHRARFLGARRYLEVASTLDMAQTATLTCPVHSVDDLNPYPHPFP